MGVNSLPKTVTRQRRGCDLNPGPSAPESSTLTTRLPSHQVVPVLVLSSCKSCSKLVLLYIFLYFTLSTTVVVASASCTTNPQQIEQMEFEHLLDSLYLS